MREVTPPDGEIGVLTPDEKEGPVMAKNYCDNDRPDLDQVAEALRDRADRIDRAVRVREMVKDAYEIVLRDLGMVAAGRRRA